MITVRTANPKDDFPALVNIEGDISIAVAYVTVSGLRNVTSGLRRRCKNGNNVRFLLALDGSGTEPAAVNQLVELSKRHKNHFQVKTFVPDPGQGIFHNKLYIAQQTNVGTITFITGSCNLTGGALWTNIEHGLWVECHSSENIGHETLAIFRQIWEHDQSISISDELANLYEEGCEKGPQGPASRPKWRRFARFLRDQVDNAKRPNLLTELRREFWAKYAQKHPEDFLSNHEYKGSTVDHKVNGLLICQSLTQREARIYIRPRNMDYTQGSLQRTQNYASILESSGGLTLLPNPTRDRDLRTLDKLRIDSTNRDNWTEMIAWLHERLQTYRETVRKKNT